MLHQEMANRLWLLDGWPTQKTSVDSSWFRNYPSIWRSGSKPRILGTMRISHCTLRACFLFFGGSLLPTSVSKSVVKYIFVIFVNHSKPGKNSHSIPEVTYLVSFPSKKKNFMVLVIFSGKTKPIKSLTTEEVR